MIQLNLTLGNSFWKHYYLPYCAEFGEILPKIRKHKVVLSERLINYYEECAKDLHMEDVCSTCIQDLVQFKNKCEFVPDYGEESIADEIMAIASKQKMKIVLAEKEEIKKAPSKINLLTSKDIRENDDCILNIYTLPVPARYIPANQPVERYKNWLANWLKDEKNIIIRDKYLLKDSGLKSFKNHFLPLFEKGSCISIHTDNDVEQEYLDEFDKPEYNDYQINVYKCEKMHDRVILLDDFQIVIGRGVGFMSGDWNKTSECFISISDITMDPQVTIIKQLR